MGILNGLKLWDRKAKKWEKNFYYDTSRGSVTFFRESGDGVSKTCLEKEDFVICIQIGVYDDTYRMIYTDDRIRFEDRDGEIKEATVKFKFNDEDGCSTFLSGFGIEDVENVTDKVVDQKGATLGETFNGIHILYNINEVDNDGKPVLARAPK
jgi:hypothetical protein